MTIKDVCEGCKISFSCDTWIDVLMQNNELDLKNPGYQGKLIRVYVAKCDERQ